MFKRNLQRLGFSLMELLVVVTILGVLAVIIVPRITTTSATAEQRADEQNRLSINSAIEQYYIDQGAWPTDLTVLDGHLDYFPDGIPVNPTDGSTYSMNTTTHRLD